MKLKLFRRGLVAVLVAAGIVFAVQSAAPLADQSSKQTSTQAAIAHDVSAPRRNLDLASEDIVGDPQQNPSPAPTPPDMTRTPGLEKIDDRSNSTT